MDENKPPEPQPSPQAAPSNPMATLTADAPTGGPVPFAGPADSAIPQEHRTQALLSWVLMFVVGFLSPLIFYFISTDKPFVKYHAAVGLSACITSLVVVIGIIILGVILGLISPSLLMLVGLLYMAFGLAMLAVVIMGAIAGNSGSKYEPPLVGAVAKAIFKV